MRWDACRDWQAFPRASDACDRDGSLLLLKSIAHPKGTRQVESVSADDVGRYPPPQRPAAQCGLPISAPSHGRPVKPHPIQLCSSCFSRPAPLVLRLFPVAPKGPPACLPLREDCLLPPGRIVVRRRAPKGATHSCLSQKGRIPAFRRKKRLGGPLTNENLEGEGSDGDLPLGVILWESKNTKRIGTGDSLLDNIKDNATLLGLQAVFAARPFPLGTASPPGLPHRTRLRPRSSSTVSGQHHDAGAGLAATSVLCLRPGPRFYAAPPYAAQHCSTFANPQTLHSCPRPENHHGFQAVATRKRSTPSPACGRFTPSSICIRLSGSSPACEG